MNRRGKYSGDSLGGRINRTRTKQLFRKQEGKLEDGAVENTGGVVVLVLSEERQWRIVYF